MRKEGSKFDLPIAIGILIASQNIENPYLNEFLKETIFIGELALDGKVERVKGILPICKRGSYFRRIRNFAYTKFKRNNAISKWRRLH